MPEFWDQLNETVAASGIDITEMLGPVQTISGVQVGIWLPDIIFPDAKEMVVSDQFLKLYPNGQLDWSRHIIATLLQSEFDYADYPRDTQTIVFRFNSNSLGLSSFLFYPKDPAVVLYQSYSNSYSFLSNPIWKFNTMISYITEEDNGTPGSPRIRSVQVVEVTITRKPKGMQLRLAIPIFLLVFLAALAFWADPADRMNTTVTVLLAVSALYIIVFQNIPMIGYLTLFDLFVLFMFFILFGCCILHQLIVRLTRMEKVSKWPMRNFYVRLLEIVGRLYVIPLVSSVFLAMFFTDPSEYNTVYQMSICIGMFTIFVGFREYFALESAFKKSMKIISNKFEHLDDLSMPEIIMFNLYKYHEFSWSLRRHIRELRRLEEEQNQQHSSDALRGTRDIADEFIHDKRQEEDTIIDCHIEMQEIYPVTNKMIDLTHVTSSAVSTPKSSWST